MKKTDRPVVIIHGDNNTVNFDNSPNLSAATVISLGVVAGAAVLAVAYCCPESLADFVRWMISTVVGG